MSLQDENRSKKNKKRRYDNYKPEPKAEIKEEPIEVKEEVAEEPVEVKEEVVEEPKKQMVSVAINDLNIRKGPGKEFERTGKFTGKGEFAVKQIKDGWAELEDGGWICMEFCELK